MPPVAANCCEYADPTVPEGKGEVVVMARLVTVIDRDCVAELLVESVTFTVNVEVPVLVAVPDIVIELVVLEPRESPAGNDPEEIDHVNGEEPVALIVVL